MAPKAALTGSLAVVVASVIVALLGIEEQRRRQLSEFDEQRKRRNQDFLAEQDRRREDFLYSALRHFGGKSQERSIGISIVDGLWDTTPKLHVVYIPLLINQAVFLLSESGQADATHELFNLRRIMALLIEARHRGSEDEKLKAYYAELTALLRSRLKDWGGKGVNARPEELNSWLGRLDVNEGEVGTGD